MMHNLDPEHFIGYEIIDNSIDLQVLNVYCMDNYLHYILQIGMEHFL